MLAVKSKHDLNVRLLYANTTYVVRNKEGAVVKM